MVCIKTFFVGALLAISSASAASEVMAARSYPVVPRANRLSPNHASRASIANAHAKRSADMRRRAAGPVNSVNSLLATTQSELSYIIGEIGVIVGATTAANAEVSAYQLTALLSSISIQLDVSAGASAQLLAAPSPSGAAGDVCDVVSTGIVESLLNIIVALEASLSSVEALFPAYPLLESLLENSVDVIQAKLAGNISTLDLIFPCLKATLIQALIAVGLGSLVGVIV